MPFFNSCLVDGPPADHKRCPTCHRRHPVTAEGRMAPHLTAEGTASERQCSGAGKAQRTAVTQAALADLEMVRDGESVEDRTSRDELAAAIREAT